MKRPSVNRRRLPRKLVPAIFAIALLLIAGFAVAGPDGLIALNKNRHLLDQRTTELASMTKQRDKLQNRVDLLDPSGADVDLVGELLRSELGVAHPDEVVVILK